MRIAYVAVISFIAIRTYFYLNQKQMLIISIASLAVFIIATILLIILLQKEKNIPYEQSSSKEHEKQFNRKFWFLGAVMVISSTVSSFCANSVDDSKENIQIQKIENLQRIVDSLTNKK